MTATTPLPPDASGHDACDPERDAFCEAVERDTERISRRPTQRANPLLGLGTLGLVGWSIVVPTLGGLALGLWLDSRFPGSGISWTITGLLGGLTLGAIAAAHWVEEERKAIHRKREDGDE